MGVIIRSIRSGAAAMPIMLCVGTAFAQIDTAVSIPFRLVDNRAFVDVMADDRGPFSFIVDTGSSGSTISEQLRDKLRLTITSTGTSDGAGEARVVDQQASLRSLKVGPVELGPLPIDVMSIDPLKRAIGFRRFDGVIGAELFRKYVVTFDFDRSRLQLEQPAAFHPEPGAVAVPITLNGDDMPVVNATISGLDGAFEVDTGDRSALTLFGPFWRAHRLDDTMAPTVTVMTGYGIGGPVRSIVGRMPHLAIGAVVCSAPVTRLSLQKSGAFVTSDYAGSIGIGVLKRFIVSFDYAHKTLYLLPRASIAPSADGFDRSGMWLGLDRNRKVVVMDLVPNGPAANAGFNIGDMVVAIDGKPLSADRIFAVREALRNPETVSVTVRGGRAGAPEDHVVVLKDLIAPG